MFCKSINIKLCNAVASSSFTLKSKKIYIQWYAAWLSNQSKVNSTGIETDF